MFEKNVYLHIGAPKTGTTALQYFLYDNRNILKHHNILYPDFNFHFPGVHDNRNAHFLIQKCYTPDRHRIFSKENDILKNGIAKLTEYIAKYPVIILSEESIWNESEMNTDAFDTLKKSVNEAGANLKIIVYLRRQDEVLPSYWAQLVKNRLTMSFEDFIRSNEYKRYRLYYANRLDEIAKAVGGENIIVRPYEKQQFKGKEHTLFSDFLHIFNLSINDGFSENDKIRNVKLSRLSLEVKRLLNKHPYFCEKKSFVVPILESIQNMPPYNTNSKNEIYFSYKDRIEFLNLFEYTNKKTAQKYLNRENGQLFLDEITLPTQEKATIYSSEELVALCGEIIIELKNQNKLLHSKLEEQGHTKYMIKCLFKKLLNKFRF